MHGKMCGADNFSLQRWELRERRVNKRFGKATALVNTLQPPVLLMFTKETPLFTGNVNFPSSTKAHFQKQCAISAGREPCLPTMQYKRIQATASTGGLSSTRTARKETASLRLTSIHCYRKLQAGEFRSAVSAAFAFIRSNATVFNLTEGHPHTHMAEHQPLGTSTQHPGTALGCIPQAIH